MESKKSLKYTHKDRSAAISRRRALQLLGAAGSIAAGISFGARVPAEGAIAADWSSNYLGMSGQVVAPWTPLRRQGIRISCWGREYDFTDGALLSQLVSQGRELLSAGARLSIETNDFAGGTAKGVFQVVRGSEALFELSGSLTLGPCSMQHRVILEYDGLMTIQTTLQPTQRVEIHALWLDIPLRHEHARYIHYASSHNLGRNFAGGLPAGQGRVWESSVHPYLWLGDDERGLAWFTESYQNWVSPRIEVIKDGGSVLLRLNFISSPLVVRDPLKFAFGLQGTPVKPLPRDWRLRRLTSGLGGPDGTNYIVWPVQMDPVTRQSTQFYPYHSLPSIEPGVFPRLMDFLHRRGKRVIAYARVTYLPTDVPGYAQHAAKVILKPDLRESANVMRQATIAVCPGSREWQDFFMARLEKLLTTVPVDGLYFDSSIVRGCENIAHGHGYRDDRGRMNKTWPFVEYRNFHKRIYSLCKSKDPDFFIILHTSERMTIPAFTFADAYLDGEQFGNPQYLQGVNLPPLIDEYLFPRGPLSINMLRAEFMGKQWGLAPYFLPEFAPEHRKPEPTESLLSLLALHDVLPWGVWCDAKTVERYLNALNSFGMKEVEFVPYWERRGAIPTSGSVAVSHYRRPGDALLVIGNLGFDPLETKISLRPSELGLSGMKPLVALEMLSGVQIQVESPGRQIALRLPKRGLRLVRVSEG